MNRYEWRWRRLVLWMLRKEWFKDMWCKYSNWKRLIAKERVEPSAATQEAFAAGVKLREERFGLNWW